MTGTQGIIITRYGKRDCGLVEYEGPFDMDLAEDGVKAAKELASKLKADGVQVAAVLSSPFRRAVHTGAVLAEQLGVSLHLEMGLTEWLDPSLVGRDHYQPPSPQKLQEDFPVISNEYDSLAYPSFPETEDELKVRIAATAKHIVAKNSDRTVILVSHAPCNLAAVIYMDSLVGGEGKQAIRAWPLGGTYQYTRQGDDWANVRRNDTSHLSPPYNEGLEAWNLPSLS